VRLGGVATRAQLLTVTSRAEVDAALAGAEIVVVGRGRYALPEADHALRAAHRLSGVVSHFSAALLWGWGVKHPPPLPEVTLPRNRKVSRERRVGVVLHRAELEADEVAGTVTTRERTLVDCLRSMDLAAGLAVADSALRDGFSASRLARLADAAKGPGSRQVRRLAAEASELPDNPFESALRAIALEVTGLHVRPQVPIFSSGEFLGRPDLVDEDLMVVLEADSFEWHGGRAQLNRDARRYNAFVVNGWLVLRFAWEDVMFDPDYVFAVLAAVVDERTQRRPWRTGAA
jgi:very-short-patch-repair endonuclease